MLDREIGEIGPGSSAATMSRIDQPGTDRNGSCRRHGLDHVAEPAFGDRVDVVVQKTDQGATGHVYALAVCIRERPVLRVPDDLHREGHLVPLGELGRPVGRAVVDDDDLDIAVSGRRNGAQTALEVVAAVAVQDDDGDQRTALDGRRRERAFERLDERELGCRRGPHRPVVEPLSAASSDGPCCPTWQGDDPADDPPADPGDAAHPRGTRSTIDDRPSGASSPGSIRSVPPGSGGRSG